MSLTTTKTDRLIAIIKGGRNDGTKIYLDINNKGPSIYQANEEESIFPTINTHLRSICYIAGQQGSGKSFFANMWIKNALKFYPKQKVFLISPIKDDPSFKDLKPLETDLEDPEAVMGLSELTKEDLSNSFVIFDDTDTIRDPMVLKIVNNLRDNLLETGRHSDTKLVITSHLITNYKSTRLLLNESTEIVIYPKSGATYGITQYLKTYLGMNKDQIAKILNSDSRWVYISKTYPIYCVTENQVFIP